MRVLWVCHFLPFPATGHGALQRTHQLLVRTARRHEVGVIALARADTAAERATIEAAHRELAPQLSFLDVVPFRSGRWQRRRVGAAVKALLGASSYWEHWFDQPSLRSGLDERRRSFAPQVVHLDTVLLARHLCRHVTEPAVLTHHNIESDLLADRARMMPRPMRWFMAREAAKVAARERQVAGQVAANVMVSDDDAARLRELAPEARTVVVPNGVDTDYFHVDSRVTARPGSLVFAGGMDWYPNRIAMEWLASDVWPALVRERPDRTLTVIGKSPPPALTALGQSDSRVRVTGFVPDVRPFVLQSAVYICPIHVGGGTRLKVLDALAMGRPLVSTGVGVAGLGLRDGVEYLRAESASDFAQCLRRLEDDPALSTRIALAGRTAVTSRFAWNRVEGILSECFSSAAAAHSTPDHAWSASPPLAC
jgi:glycosyltransferase involved in cell wall biosynthesis